MKYLYFNAALLLTAVLVTTILVSTHTTSAHAFEQITPPLEGIAYEGQRAPWGGWYTPSGDDIFEYVDINDAGDIIFQATVWDGATNAQAIFLYQAASGTVIKAVAPGDPCPITGVATFDSVWLPTMNNKGDIVFLGGYEMPAIPPNCPAYDARGYFIRHSDGSMECIVNSTELVYTKGSLQGHFCYFKGKPYIDNYGTLVFGATVLYYDPSDLICDRCQGGGGYEDADNGLFRVSDTGSLSTVIRQGDPAPGGGEYGNYIASPYCIQENDRGDISFMRWTDNDPRGALTGALFYKPQGGAIQRIVSTNETVDYYIPGTETVHQIEVTSIDPVGMNNHGQVAFILWAPSYEYHLFQYSDGKFFKIAGYRDPSPTPWQRWGPYYIDSFLSDGSMWTADIGDNRVILPDGQGYCAETVFQAPVQAFGLQAWDVYAYNSDGQVRPVVMGNSDNYAGDPAPNPPGGTMFVMEGEVAMNNHGQVVVTRSNLPSDGEIDIIAVASLDRDGDGLLDIWETDGIDVNGDGIVDLVLPDADPDHKDLYVEIDYMKDGTHDHKPNQDAINDVINAFKNSPVKNPDAVDGIDLHVLVDEDIPFTEELAMMDGFDDLKATWFGTTDEWLHPNYENIIASKKLAYHYCIFAHKYKHREGWNPANPWVSTTSSGLAECPGNDFIVSLGAFDGGIGSRDQQAATFMHELGHNLGLRHGGGDDINCKPNYLSIMSYTRQFPTYIPGRPLDYSRSKLPALNENGGLNEPSGIGGNAVDKTVFFVDTNSDGYNDGWTRGAGNAPLDWNWNGTKTDTNVTTDVNSMISGFTGGGTPVWQFNGGDQSLQTLKGYNDWENIVYNFRYTGNYKDGAHPDLDEPDMTWELYESIMETILHATRDLPDTVGAGVVFDVGIEVAGCGEGGQVIETLPAGFSYIGCTGVGTPTQNGNEITFEFSGDSITFTYSVQAAGDGSWVFSGIVRDSQLNEVETGGDTEVQVGWSPWIYDTNENEELNYNEMVNALMDYLVGDINYSRMVQVLMLYLTT